MGVAADVSIDLLKWTGSNLASGALQYFEGVGLGALLKEMTPSGDNDAEIVAIGSQLSQIQSTLDQIQVELKELWDDIDAQLEKIEEGQLYSDWEAIDKDMREAITQISTQYDTYLSYAGAATAPPRGGITSVG